MTLLLTYDQGLRPRDKVLVKAFAEREVMDFRAGWEGSPATVEQYAAKHMERIEELLRRAPEAEELRFQSLGNTGCVIRELRLEPKRYDFGDNGRSLILCITFDTFSPASPPSLQILRRKWKHQF